MASVKRSPLRSAYLDTSAWLHLTDEEVGLLSRLRQQKRLRALVSPINLEELLQYLRHDVPKVLSDLRRMRGEVLPIVKTRNGLG